MIADVKRYLTFPHYALSHGAVRSGDKYVTIEMCDTPNLTGPPRADEVDQPAAERATGRHVVNFKPSLSIAPATLLAACGGGSNGSGSNSTVTPPVVVVPTAITDVEASRFLGQATMGATRATIDEVVAKGFEGWLDSQFALPRSGTLWDAMAARGQTDFANVNSLEGFDATIWRSLIVEPDQLRQRVASSLLDFLVVGSPLDTPWPRLHATAFIDLLMDNAFGNYRTILDKITHNPAMAIWLSLINNRKANATTGAMPDENYAREVMQLFSIGLYQLNMDGSLKIAGGAPIDTYTQSDVSQLARVFTGLVTPDYDWRKPTLALTPLVMNAPINETGPSTFLGKTISGGGTEGLNAALDHLFSHANVPPFVSKQLIQRLVTSNPSPAYVQRVSTVFADNGKGVRGDIQAVVRAILTDNEARSAAAITSTTAGRLRSPVERLTGWARAFKAASPSNAWAIGNTSNPATGIGQSTGEAPSVFNFFRPGYTPPGSQIQTLGLVGPEFQITNEQSVMGYINFMYRLVAQGIGDVQADYSALTAKASDSAALIEEVNVLVAAGQLSAGSIATIKGAVDSAGATQNRIWTAVLLTLVAPEFLVTR